MRILRAEIVAAALALSAATATAGAAAPGGEQCRRPLLEVPSGRPLHPCVNDARDRLPAEHVRVVRTAFVTSGEERDPSAAERFPEPGGWAILIAGILGGIMIVRRRLS